MILDGIGIIYCNTKKAADSRPYNEHFSFSIRNS